MRPKWLKLATCSLAQTTFTSSSLVYSLLPKDKLFKKMFDLITAGERDCVAMVEGLPALHYSVDFIFCPLESLVPLWNFKTIRESMMRPKWLKLASQAQKICTLCTFTSLVYSLLLQVNL